MSWSADETQCFHLSLGHFDASLIVCRVENGLHFQAGLSLRGTDEVHNSFVIQQRLAFPSETDKGKEPMLDFVPLAGTRRIVTHRYRQSSFVGELL
jgi:hypothetical protein